MWIILLLLLAPFPVPALDGTDAATGGGGATAVAASAYAAKKALDARKRRKVAKIVEAEATRWGWTEDRKLREASHLFKREIK